MPSLCFAEGALMTPERSMPYNIPTSKPQNTFMKAFGGGPPQGGVHKLGTDAAPMPILGQGGANPSLLFRSATTLLLAAWIHAGGSHFARRSRCFDPETPRRALGTRRGRPILQRDLAGLSGNARGP